MNCINVIPVVKVGLEVEFLSGSTFRLSFLEQVGTAPRLSKKERKSKGRKKDEKSG